MGRCAQLVTFSRRAEQAGTRQDCNVKHRNFELTHASLDEAPLFLPALRKRLCAQAAMCWLASFPGRGRIVCDAEVRKELLSIRQSPVIPIWSMSALAIMRLLRVR